MKALESIKDRLLSRRRLSQPLTIPRVWNSFGTSSVLSEKGQTGEIRVEASGFFTECIDHILAHPQAKTSLEIRSTLPPVNQTSVIYGMQIRSATAWQTQGTPDIAPGTFLRSLCLIPYLKSLHIDVVYLLPIFATGGLYQKGELGSPYSVRDPFKLSAELHDPYLGAFSEDLLDLQFQAFVEACHLWGLRVIVDFTFRTAARDSAWILQHPDWFYWVKKSFSDNFKPLSPQNPVPRDATHTDINRCFPPTAQSAKPLFLRCLKILLFQSIPC